MNTTASKQHTANELCQRVMFPPLGQSTWRSAEPHRPSAKQPIQVTKSCQLIFYIFYVFFIQVVLSALYRQSRVACWLDGAKALSKYLPHMIYGVSAIKLCLPVATPTVVKDS